MAIWEGRLEVYLDVPKDLPQALFRIFEIFQFAKQRFGRYFTLRETLITGDETEAEMFFHKPEIEQISCLAAYRNNTVQWGSE